MLLAKLMCLDGSMQHAACSLHARAACCLPARWPGGSGVKLEKSSRITCRLPLAAAASNSARSSSSASASACAAAGSCATSWPLGFFAWHLRRLLLHAAAAVLPKARASGAGRRAGCTDAPAEGKIHSCIFRKAVCCRSKGFRELQRVFWTGGAAVAGHSAFAAVHNRAGNEHNTRLASASAIRRVQVKHLTFAESRLAGSPVPQFRRGIKCIPQPHTAGCQREPWPKCDWSEIARPHLGRALGPQGSSHGASRIMATAGAGGSPGRPLQPEQRSQRGRVAARQQQRRQQPRVLPPGQHVPAEP